MIFRHIQKQHIKSFNIFLYLTVANLASNTKVKFSYGGSLTFSRHKVKTILDSEWVIMNQITLPR